jgi:hypothetical protein
MFLSSDGGSVERCLILWHLGRAGLSHNVNVALPRSKGVFTAAGKYLQVCNRCTDVNGCKNTFFYLLLFVFISL